MKPSCQTNGQGSGAGAGGGVGGQGKTPSPSASLINHIALDDERKLREMYEFGDRLGAGSFGVVWLVTHISSGQQYACKVINKEKVVRLLAHLGLLCAQNVNFDCPFWGGTPCTGSTMGDGMLP